MPRRADDLFPRIASFQALLAAAGRAARGKRRKPGAAAFLAGLVLFIFMALIVPMMQLSSSL